MPLNLTEMAKISFMILGSFDIHIPLRPLNRLLLAKSVESIEIVDVEERSL